MGTVPLSACKMTRPGIDHPPNLSPMLKMEWSCGSLWPVLGWNLPLLQPIPHYMFSLMSAAMHFAVSLYFQTWCHKPRLCKPRNFMRKTGLCIRRFRFLWHDSMSYIEFKTIIALVLLMNYMDHFSECISDNCEYKMSSRIVNVGFSIYMIGLSYNAHHT
jgi:hypothetical protein